MREKNEMYGLTIVFVGAVLWGTLSLFVKLVGMDAYLFSFLRYFVASVFLMPFILKGGIPFNLNVIGFVLSYLLLGVTLILSILYTANAIAVGMQFTAPLWVFVYNLFCGNRQSKKSMLPLFVILVGLLIFMLTPGKGVTWYGNLLAFTSGVLFGLLTIFSSRIKTDNPIGLTGVANLLSVLPMLIWYLLLGGSLADFASIGSTQWLCILFVGIFQTAGGFALFNYGLQYANVQKASVVSTMELVSSIIFVTVFLHEYPDIYSLLGSITIIAGITWQFIFANKESKNIKLQM